MADIITEKFSIECKLRAKLPSWLTDMIKQAKTNCVAGTVGIVIIKDKHKRDDTAIVMLELADFCRFARK